MTSATAKSKSAQLAVPQLAEEVGFNRQTVEKILAEAKIKPVFEFPAGKGFTRVYNRSDVMPAIAAYRQAQVDKLAAKNPQAAPTPGISLTGIEKQLAVNDATVAQLTERVDELTRQVGLLLQQNQVLLKKLDPIHKYTEALHTALTPASV